MKSVEKKLRILFLKLILFFIKNKSTSFEAKSFDRILIIRQHDQLGDFLISTPTIRAVRKNFPKSYISVVVSQYLEPMILNNPNVDEIIVYREKLSRWNFKWFINFIKSLRRDGGYDLAIVLNTISRSITSDLIALLSKAKNILSSDNHLLTGFKTEPVYTILSHRDEKEKTEIQRNLDIVKAIDVKSNGFDYDLFLTNEEILEGKNILKKLNLHRYKKIVGVHFGTLDVTRRFPLDKLAEVIDLIISKYNVTVLNIIGKNEIALQDEFLKLVKHKIYLAPLVPIRISASIMQNLSLFLCNDTGPLHIASALNIPTVSFHSTNDPKIWKPPHSRHIAVRTKDKLINSITVRDAMNQIHKAMTNYVN